MLRLGIPNGSLHEATMALLEKIGIRIIFDGRKFWASVQGIGIFYEAILMRPQDIPMAIARGKIDCGFCGWDCVIESGKENEVVQIAELWYGKKTRNAVKVVVISKGEELRDEHDVLVTSEYPNIAKNFFKHAQVDFSYGGTEQKVALMGYDFGICVTETGRSIVDNGLKIVKVLLKSPTVIIAREDSEEIRQFAELMLGGLNAEKYALIKMNVAQEDFANVIPVIQALKSPTINNLKRGGFAIEAVVPKMGIANLIMQLRQRKASGIIVQDINSIV